MSRKALGRGLSALFTEVNSLESNLVELDVALLDPSQAQPRRVFKEEKLEELAQSIRSTGLIQPILVRRSGDRFQIIAGERRWRAAMKAGLNRVPCVIKEVDQNRTLELSLIENIQREELNPIEEAAAYRSLIEQLALTQEEVANRVGKDRSSVANALRLLKLPAEIQQLVEEEKLSMGHARALLAVESADQQRTLALDIVRKSLSVRETENAVKAVTGRQPASSKSKPSPEVEGERANIAAAEAKLSKRLGAPVRIRFAHGRGTIEIGFSSHDDLSRIYDLLIRKLAE